MIWHGIFNFFTSSQIASGMISSIMSMSIILITIILYSKFGKDLIFIIQKNK